MESAYLIPMFLRQLKNCKYSSNESLVVVSDLSSRRDYVSASVGAAITLGGTAYEVRLPILGRGIISSNKPTINLGGMLRLPRSVVEGLKSADLIFDITMEGFIHTPERIELQKSGVRILRVGNMPPQILSRLMPWDDEEAASMKNRALIAAKKLMSAKEMHVRSEAGTDFYAKLSPNATFASYGFSDEKGRWDVWGQNMVSNYPVDSYGKIVINVGDYNVTPFAMYHTSKIELVIENNMVKEILGEGFDAKLMREHLASYKDPNAYYVSHVGWGLNKKAMWANMATYDRAPDERGVSGDEGRVFWGNFLFSTGPNYHIGRFTSAHYDIALKDCDIYLDGELIVKKGRVVSDE